MFRFPQNSLLSIHLAVFLLLLFPIEVPALVCVLSGADSSESESSRPTPVRRKVKFHHHRKRKAVRDAQTTMKKALPPEMAELFPVGRVFKGVAIPTYNEDALESVLNSAIVRRKSEDYLDFTNLVIHFYNSAGEAETAIQMDKAVYHLGDGLLTSQTPAHIEQDRFSLRGGQLLFETDTHLARLKDGVHMNIFDAPRFDGPRVVPVGAPPGAAPRETDRKPVEITAREAAMDNINRQITFVGDVVVKNEEDHVTLRCDRFQVFLTPEHSIIRDADGRPSKISRAVARGGMVEIRKIDSDGKAQIALAREAEFDAISKDAVLSGGPPSLQDGNGDYVTLKSKDGKIILRGDGRYEIIGSERHTINIKGDGKGSSSFGFGEENN